MGIKVLTEFEDLANVRLKFENNCVANLTASRLTPEPQRKIRIFQKDAGFNFNFSVIPRRAPYSCGMGLRSAIIYLLTSPLNHV
jgi:hypothetical protein